MKFQIKPYSFQELGMRENQEDSLFPALGEAKPSDRLFILCDGMGGHVKGEVASATICTEMSKYILEHWNEKKPFPDSLITDALNAAIDILDALDTEDVKKMGTTMTFLCLHNDGATVAHIGDSRVYQLRPASESASPRVVFVTRDHSLVNDLVAVGEITEEEAKNHPQKNVITRAIQPNQSRRVRADIKHLTDIKPGDYFYMCSDGMLEKTPDEELLSIVTNPKNTDEEKIEMLLNVTADNCDNHTAHLIKVIDVKDVTAVSSAFESTSPMTANNNTLSSSSQNSISAVRSTHQSVNRPVFKPVYQKDQLPKRSFKGLFLAVVAVVLVVLFVAIGAICWFFRGDDINTYKEEQNTESTIGNDKKSGENSQNAEATIKCNDTILEELP